MAFRKLYEVHQGKVGLKLFRSTQSKGLFLAIDKIVDGRTLRGPFLSEADIRFFVRLLAEHKKSRPRNRALEPAAEVVKPALPDGSAVQLEIEEAVARARDNSSKRWKLTVVSPLPKYEYVHTCSICGCHVESVLRLAPGMALRLCPACEHVHASTVQG